MKIRFYNGYELKRVPSGLRFFDVGTIGRKWVKIKESPSDRWMRISVKNWEQIKQAPRFEIIPQQENPS